MVDDAGDAERAGEAQQVGQETEGDAEDQGPAEGLPQGLPDLLWPQGDRALGPLVETNKAEDERENKGWKGMRRSEVVFLFPFCSTA